MLRAVLFVAAVAAGWLLHLVWSAPQGVREEVDSPALPQLSAPVPGYRIYTDQRDQLERWTGVAHHADEIAHRTLGISRTNRATIPIHICDSREQAQRLINRIYGENRPSTSTFQGKFLPGPNVIVVIDGERIEGTIAHEVAHAVLHHHAPHCPPALNEGLACHVETSFNGFWRDRTRRAWCARLLEDAVFIEPRELIGYDYDDFHSSTRRDNYLYALLLVDLLVYSEWRGVQGKLPELYAAFRVAGKDPWRVFGETIDRQVFRKRWKAQLDWFRRTNLPAYR
ncbi:MAG: hypothetical protein ACYTHK_12640 [Planctomycetota bacterium]|jgi:hypothetical protein